MQEQIPFLKTLTFGTGLEVNVSLFLFLVFRGGESVRSTTESLLLSLSDHMIFLWKYLLSSSIQGMAKVKYNKDRVKISKDQI